MASQLAAELTENVRMNIAQTRSFLGSCVAALGSLGGALCRSPKREAIRRTKRKADPSGKRQRRRRWGEPFGEPSGKPMPQAAPADSPEIATPEINAAVTPRDMLRSGPRHAADMP